MVEERELHLRDYLRTLYKRRLTVLTFFVIVFVVVLIGALSATPIYEATTKVLIEKVELQSMSMMNPYYSSYDPEFSDPQLQLSKALQLRKKW